MFILKYYTNMTKFGVDYDYCSFNSRTYKIKTLKPWMTLYPQIKEKPQRFMKNNERRVSLETTKRKEKEYLLKHSTEDNVFQ